MRWRAPIVLVPLTLGLCYSGYLGAQMLWGEDPEPEASAATVTCWDGAEATAEECPAPTGVRGLRWAFGSFAPGDRRCSRVVYDGDLATRPLEFTCRTRLEGTTARVNYSERSSLERGIAYFDQRYDGLAPISSGAGTRLVYRDPAPRNDGTYEAAVVYTDYPFAVTVRAVNERLRDAVLDDVVLRPARDMRVRPSPSPRS